MGFQLWTWTDLQFLHLRGRYSLSLPPVLYENRVQAGFRLAWAPRTDRHRKGCPAPLWRSLETCALRSSCRLRASPAPLKSTSCEIYDEFPVPTPRGSCQGDRLKAHIYGKWHFLNKMMIKEHVRFLLFRSLQRQSSECEDHTGLGHPPPA